jgi:hypothetical protein
MAMFGGPAYVSNGAIKVFSFMVATHPPVLRYSKVRLACLAGIDDARTDGYDDIGFQLGKFGSLTLTSVNGPDLSHPTEQKKRSHQRRAKN